MIIGTNIQSLDEEMYGFPDLCKIIALKKFFIALYLSMFSMFSSPSYYNTTFKIMNILRSAFLALLITSVSFFTGTQLFVVLILGIHWRNYSI